MFGLGTTELLIIFGIILLLFGSSRLPKLAKSAAEAMSYFKKGTAEDPIAKVLVEPKDQA